MQLFAFAVGYKIYAIPGNAIYAQISTKNVIFGNGLLESYTT